MRTLKLTHKEIELIQRALGIAEYKFMELRKQHIEQTINVRGVNNKDSTIKDETSNLFNISNEFCDLLMAINNGKKDV